MNTSEKYIEILVFMNLSVEFSLYSHINFIKTLKSVQDYFDINESLLNIFLLGEILHRQKKVHVPFYIF